MQKSLRTTALEGLNSSLAQSGCQPRVDKVGQKWPMSPFLKISNFCQKLGFWAIILSPVVLASQSRAQRPVFESQIQKIFERKKFALGWRPGPGKGAKNAQTRSHCDVTHKKTKSKPKNIFSISSWKLAESTDGLINSPVLLVGKLWLAKVWATIVALRSLRG